MSLSLAESDAARIQPGAVRQATTLRTSLPDPAGAVIVQTDEDLDIITGS